MNNKYKLVLFDFDNTLYSGKKFAKHLILNDLIHILRIKAERDVRKLLAGKEYADNKTFKDAFYSQIAQKSHSSASKIATWYENKYIPSMVNILAKNYTMRPNADKMINSLITNGYKVGVLSDYPMVRERLKAIGLENEQLYAWSAEDFGALKPSPKSFLSVAKELNVKPEEALFIGDRADTDGLGSLAAGMDCILLENPKAQNDKNIKVLNWSEIITYLSI